MLLRLRFPGSVPLLSNAEQNAGTIGRYLDLSAMASHPPVLRQCREVKAQAEITTLASTKAYWGPENVRDQFQKTANHIAM